METKYLDMELMQYVCHRVAVEFFDSEDHPIPPFGYRDLPLLDSAISRPKATFDGKELYSDYNEKAAVLYYSLIKNHAFPNGNKRIAIASFLVFLAINNYWLKDGVSNNEVVNKALNVSDSDSKKMDEVVEDLKHWIENGIERSK